MSSKLTLAYFPLRGAGDPIRMVLHHAGVDYNDYHIALDEWAGKKGETPFGHVPVLKLDDRKYGETLAIMRYLGEKHGMTANTLEEKMFADSIVYAVKDLMGPILGPVYDKSQEDRKTYFAEKLIQLPSIFECVEREMGKHTTNGFLASNKLTWQDCQLLGRWNILVHFMGPNVFDKTPTIKKHYETIRSQPTIASYLEKTKDMAIYV